MSTKKNFRNSKRLTLNKLSIIKVKYKNYKINKIISKRLTLNKLSIIKVKYKNSKINKIKLSQTNKFNNL